MAMACHELGRKLFRKKCLALTVPSRRRCSDMDGGRKSVLEIPLPEKGEALTKDA